MLAYIKLTVESVFVPMQGDGLQLPDKRECARVSTKKTLNGQLCNHHEGFFFGNMEAVFMVLCVSFY